MILTGENPRTQTEPCPSTALSTTNPTWTDPDANPILRDDRPATNSLSHGTAMYGIYLYFIDWLPKKKHGIVL
jgi:hypothetical protein